MLFDRDSLISSVLRGFDFNKVTRLGKESLYLLCKAPKDWNI